MSVNPSGTNLPTADRSTEHLAAARAAPPLMATASSTSSDMIPFEPLAADVVVTKKRSILHSYAGNLFYDSLLDKVKLSLKGIEDKHLWQQAAEHVVDIIQNERNGRFLKLVKSPASKTKDEDAPKLCVVMPRKDAVYKVLMALKRALQTPTQQAATAISKKSKKKRNFQYRAIANPNHPLHPSLLQWIESVCHYTNQMSDSAAIQVALQDTSDSLSSNDRRLQGQVRLRYLAAQRKEISVVDFSKRLLEFTGGELLQLAAATVAPTDKPAIPEAQTREATTAAVVAAAALSTTAATTTVLDVSGDASKNAPCSIQLMDKPPPKKKSKRKINPGVKWTQLEKLQLLHGLEKHGRGNWKLVAEHVPTRNQIQVKNRGNHVVARMKKGEDVFAELCANQHLLLPENDKEETGASKEEDGLSEST